MLDLKYILAHPDEVRENCTNRNVKADVDRVMELAAERSSLIQGADGLRHEQKAAAKRIGQASPEERPAMIAAVGDIKTRIAAQEARLKELETELGQEARRIPNMTHPDSPVGRVEEESVEIRQVGERRSFDFPVRDHVEIGEQHDLIDFAAGSKVAARNFYFLKNEAVLMELGLVRFALDRLAQRGYRPVMTPDVARVDVLDGVGFTPRGDESQIFTLEGTDLGLIATAEITLAGMLQDEILNGEELPLRFAGVSHCFRREAGAHGKASKGLYRVHQFTKIEMFAFTRPDESVAVHDEMLGLEEQINADLGLPYRVLDICTGDMGGPAYRKYDIEVWMPGRGDAGEWGEVTSTSNCTDYQARRLGIRYRPEKGAKPSLVHTLNGTAIAVSRTLLALLENYQQADGSVLIPESLQPYVGKEKIG